MQVPLLKTTAVLHWYLHLVSPSRVTEMCSSQVKWEEKGTSAIWVITLRLSSFRSFLLRRQTWFIPASLLKGTPFTFSSAEISRTSAFISSFRFQGEATILVARFSSRCFWRGQTSASSARKKAQNCSTEQGRTTSSIFCFSASTICGSNILISMPASSRPPRPFSVSGYYSLLAFRTSEDSFYFFHRARTMREAWSFLKPVKVRSSSGCWGADRPVREKPSG